jgi:hypothetical protein
MARSACYVVGRIQVRAHSAPFVATQTVATAAIIHSDIEATPLRYF